MADVGIVMPVYRQRPQYLEKALQTILEQSYRHFILVIVLDGSSQLEVDIVTAAAQRDPRIRIIQWAENRGLVNALNAGFQRCKTIPSLRYFTWVSSDNLHHPAFIETLHQLLENSPFHVGLAYAHYRLIDEHDNWIWSPEQEENFRQLQQLPKERMIDQHIIGAAFLYRREFAEKVGGYRYQYVDDYDYWLRLSEHCDIIYSPATLIEYRVGASESLSAQVGKSQESLRKYRYLMQQIKLEARLRRKIPVETTIIYGMTASDGAEVVRLEACLNQYYTNYQLLLVDRSHHRRIHILQNEIPDPRIQYLTMPGLSEEEMVRQLLPQLSTPYLYVLRQQVTSYQHLPPLLEQLQRSNAMASYYDEYGKIISRSQLAPSDPQGDHLYHTISLQRYLSR